MRSLAAILGLAYVLLSTVAAAETRTFVIANSADGYGVDQCLTTGARCGTLIADTYCQSQAYAKAASFRVMERAEITAAVVSAASSSWRPAPEGYVAIECTR
jgi:hypothetical protein